MKNFLKRLRLIDCLTAGLSIDKNEFVDKLSADVDQTAYWFFSDITVSLPVSKNQFKGRVYINGFKLKIRQKYFDAKTNATARYIISFVVGNGLFDEQNNRQLIKTGISGFSRYLGAFFLICCTVPFWDLFQKPRDEAFIVLLFLSVHATCMLTLISFFMRRSIRRLKNELDTAFYCLTKDG